MACNSTCLNHYGTLIGNRTLQINLYHCCAPLTTEVLNIMFKCYTTDKHRAAITWTRVLSIISSFSLIFQPWFHAKSTTRQPINTHFASHTLSYHQSVESCQTRAVWSHRCGNRWAVINRRWDVDELRSIFGAVRQLVLPIETMLLQLACQLLKLLGRLGLQTQHTGTHCSLSTSYRILWLTHVMQLLLII